MSTGYTYHEVFGWHDTGTVAGISPSDPRVGLQPHQSYENADTKRRIHELVVVSGLIDHLIRVDPRPATDEEILRVHRAAYLTHVEYASDQPRGGDAGDGITSIGRGGVDIARLAAGGTLAVVEEVLQGNIRNGYALVRPPGHHSRPGTGMGFCIFNNIAIAARHAQAVLGVERIAIVDWDVHHGNGTQEAFYDDPSVLTISLHQDNVYPVDSGASSERGEGLGLGYAINLPLPPGTGIGGYRYAMETVIVPAIERFGPELILVASGFDANVVDQLARQMLTSESYRELTRMLMEVADRVCGGRIAMSHEGGYNPVYVPFCGLAVLEELSGVRVLDDPMLPAYAGYAGHDLQPHQRQRIDALAALIHDIR